MPVDSEGRPYIIVKESDIDFVAREEVKNEKGEIIGYRTVRRTKEGKTKRIYDLEQFGWHKKVIVIHCFSIRVRNPDTYEWETKIICEKLELDARKLFPEKRHAYLRVMENGVAMRDFQSDMCDFPIPLGSSLNAPMKGIKRLERKAISIDELKELVKTEKNVILDTSLKIQLGLYRKVA